MNRHTHFEIEITARRARMIAMGTMICNSEEESRMIHLLDDSLRELQQVIVAGITGKFDPEYDRELPSYAAVDLFYPTEEYSDPGREIEMLDIVTRAAVVIARWQESCAAAVADYAVECLEGLLNKNAVFLVAVGHCDDVPF